MISPLSTDSAGSIAMMIRDPPKQDRMKELKVHVPVKYHLQLHSLKVLEGRQIHSMVQEALDQYFATLKPEGRHDE